MGVNKIIKRHHRKIKPLHEKEFQDSNTKQIFNGCQAQLGIAEIKVDCHETVFKTGFENTLEYNAAKALFQEFG